MLNLKIKASLFYCFALVIINLIDALKNMFLELVLCSWYDKILKKAKKSVLYQEVTAKKNIFFIRLKSMRLELKISTNYYTSIQNLLWFYLICINCSIPNRHIKTH